MALVAALFLFQLYLALREPPTVLISALVPRMNYSVVRVQGILESDARPLSDGTVFYAINDGSGAIAAFLVTTDFGALPKAGSRISFVGNLSVSLGRAPSIRALSPAQIQIEPVATPSSFLGKNKLADILAEQAGSRLTIFGQVAALRPRSVGSNAPYKIILEDPDGRLEVVCWFEPEQRLGLGDALKVYGEVCVYKGKVQLRVWDPKHIHCLQ